MQLTSFYAFRYLFLAVLSLTGLVFVFNYTHTHYLGFNYLPANVFPIGIVLVLMYIGSCLMYSKENRMSKTQLEVLYFYTIMFLIAIATNAVQLTPFQPIDQLIISLDSILHVDLPSIMQRWDSSTPLKTLLRIIYNSLPYQMTFIPLIVIFCGKTKKIREYYYLMLLSALIGFTLYYFFPTTAPASLFKSNLFTPEQEATGLKFYQIHNHLPITTGEGGLIAFPSFHTIWAIFCVNLISEWKIFFYLLGMINSILIISCIVLGWHYLLDILSGFLVSFLAIYSYKRRWFIAE